jgi:hypothetical protein
MIEVSRVVNLAHGIYRQAAQNLDTQMSGFTSGTSFNFHDERVEPLEACFKRVHWDLWRMINQQPKLGCLTAVVHESRGIVGYGWVAASSHPRALHIGRHGSVDLHVPFDESLSLRHLLLLVRARGSTVRVRALDLSSSLGLSDELGKKVIACEVDGFVGFRAAGLAVFICPTGGELPWNPSALNPWATLPERVYHDHFLGRRSVAAAPAVLAGQTLVERFAAPPTLVGDPHFSKSPIGHLEILDGIEPLLIEVGTKAFEQGVLLGRDGRCRGARLIVDISVSRVHLLLLRLDGQLLAIDTGSTNGTYYQGRKIQCSALQPGEPLSLGSHVRMRWLPFDANMHSRHPTRAGR